MQNIILQGFGSANTSELVAPRVNLNGSSAESLIRGYCDAMAAVETARKALLAIGPHGRDYQTVIEASKSLPVAEKQHRVRHAMLDRVYHEIEALAYLVSDQRK